MCFFPERLTLAFIKSAISFGARVSNYARVEGFIMEGDNRVAGVRVLDVLNNVTREVRGDVTINCGGPWADIILGLAGRGEGNETLRRSEGIHIITCRKTSDSSVVASMTPGGRHFFLIPWRGHTLIGTTDKEYVGSPDKYRVTKESIMELIALSVNSTFWGWVHNPSTRSGTPMADCAPWWRSRPRHLTSRPGSTRSTNASDGLEGLINRRGRQVHHQQEPGARRSWTWCEKDRAPMGQVINGQSATWRACL
jgi:hypothetical protein